MGIIENKLPELDLSKVPDGFYYVTECEKLKVCFGTYEKQGFTGSLISSKIEERVPFPQLYPIRDLTDKGFNFYHPKTNELMGTVKFEEPPQVSGLVLAIKNGETRIFMPQVSYDPFMEYVKNQTKK